MPPRNWKWPIWEFGIVTLQQTQGYTQQEEQWRKINKSQLSFHLLDRHSNVFLHTIALWCGRTQILATGWDVTHIYSVWLVRVTTPLQQHLLEATWRGSWHLEGGGPNARVSDANSSAPRPSLCPSSAELSCKSGDENKKRYRIEKQGCHCSQFVIKKAKSCFTLMLDINTKKWCFLSVRSEYIFCRQKTFGDTIVNEKKLNKYWCKGTRF